MPPVVGCAPDRLLLVAPGQRENRWRRRAPRNLQQDPAELPEVVQDLRWPRDDRAPEGETRRHIPRSPADARLSAARAHSLRRGGAAHRRLVAETQGLAEVVRWLRRAAAVVMATAATTTRALER